MPVNTKHPDYSAWIAKVVKCRKVIEGQDAVKAAEDDFLPRPSGATPADYQEYLKRSVFFPATGRTVDALTGSIFRKTPQVVVPEAMVEFMMDVDQAGSDFRQFAKRVVRDVVGVSRAGVLVDYSTTANTPVLRFYTAESIINWDSKYVDGQWFTTMVVLEEEILVQGEDMFSKTREVQYRVLFLDENGVYTSQIYRKGNDNKFTLDPTSTVQPRIRGAGPLDYIPFTCFNPFEVGFNTAEPVISGIADLNIAHYGNYADLEMARHYTAQPTPVVIGVKRPDDAKSYKIGSKAAWFLAEKGSDAKFLEYTGAGLQYLADGIKEKENQMAMLGARLVRTDGGSRGDSTAYEWEIRNASETSVLGSVADSVSDGLTSMLKDVAVFMGLPIDDIVVRLNTDFVNSRMNSDEIRALTEAVQSGVLAPEVYVHNLVKGELVGPDFDAEREVARLTDVINTNTTQQTPTPSVTE